MKNYEESLELYSYISNELREIRKDKQLTLNDVATEVGISYNFLSDIERAYRNTTNLLVVLNLAQFYEVDINDVIRNAKLRMEIDNKLKG